MKDEKIDQLDLSDLNQGKVSPIGVGLTEGELNAIKVLAEAHNVAPHALLKLAVREFIKTARAGKIDIETYFEVPPPPKKRLKRT